MASGKRICPICGACFCGSEGYHCEAPAVPVKGRVLNWNGEPKAAKWFDLRDDTETITGQQAAERLAAELWNDDVSGFQIDPDLAVFASLSVEVEYSDCSARRFVVYPTVTFEAVSADRD